MSKLNLDKYYTSTELAKYCVDKTKEIIGDINITEYLEPSAGSGVFLPFLDKPYIAYDIEPENDKVIKQDYLELNLKYKKGRCTIGNPPFGKQNKLSVKFYKKSVQICDYISFILPVSQLNNNRYMYEFDLIYSEDLGKKPFSDRLVHCCLNIYKRNLNGLNKFIKSEDHDLNEISLRCVNRGVSRNDKVPIIYDFSISGFSNNIGKICDKEWMYCAQIYFTIHPQYKEIVRKLIETTNWKDVYPTATVPKLKIWQVNKYLKEQIPQLTYKQKESKLGKFL